MGVGVGVGVGLRWGERDFTSTQVAYIAFVLCGN